MIHLRELSVANAENAKQEANYGLDIINIGFIQCLAFGYQQRQSKFK